MPSDDSSSTDSPASTNDFVSKTELKRLAQQATDIGKQLVSLDKATLNKLDLPANVLENIIAAQAIKSNIARKRQLQFLGKQIRNSDMQHIHQQLARLQQQHRHDAAQFHKLEQWRDQLIQQKDAAINRFVSHFPHADRQHLRQLVRQAQQESEKNAAPAAARKLFRYIKDIVGSN
jgi:ribosome-associated protein